MSVAGFKHLDLAGTPIAAGNYVVYPTRHASWMEMKYGLVTRVGYREQPPHSKFDSQPVVKVTSVRKGYIRGKPSWERQNRGAEVTLDRLDRVLVICRDEVAETAREMLDMTEAQRIGIGGASW